VQRVTVLSLELRLAGSGAAASSGSAAETSASYRFREIGPLMAFPEKAWVPPGLARLSQEAGKIEMVGNLPFLVRRLFGELGR
jgi:hypothetical protein